MEAEETDAEVDRIVVGPKLMATGPRREGPYVRPRWGFFFLGASIGDLSHLHFRLGAMSTYGT